jgi:hypothetical protein
MISRRSRAGAFWTWTGALAAVGIAVVTTVGAFDHVRKTHAIETANVAKWFCFHRGTDCDERKPDDIEDAWSAREHFYQGLDVGFFVVAVVAVIVVRRSRE